ncbi:MAG: hypothetical protein LBP76_01315 [Treponema sp.]|jgi:hypothetical protein|nr:hypothetical protein [Treponema sp.]
MKKFLPVIAAWSTGALLCLLASCTQFFSTSLAPWAARDPASLIPPVTTGNVHDLIGTAENDPDMSLALLKGINDAMAGASAEEKVKLQTAALEVAVNASSLGPSLLNKVEDSSALAEDPQKAKQMVLDSLNDMENLTSTADTLALILPDPSDEAAFGAFTDTADADSLAMAAAVLLAAEAKKEANSGDFLENFDPADTALSDSAKLAVKLAEAAKTKNDNNNEGSGMLKDMLEGLNLS